MMLRIARRNQIDLATEPSGVLTGETVVGDGTQWGGTKDWLPLPPSPLPHCVGDLNPDSTLRDETNTQRRRSPFMLSMCRSSGKHSGVISHYFSSSLGDQSKPHCHDELPLLLVAGKEPH